MRLTSFLVTAVVAAVLAACAGRAQRAAAPSYPVTKFILSTFSDPEQAVEIVPEKFGGGYDAWNIRRDFRGLPLVLHNDRTVRVVRSIKGHAAYMANPLCQAFPTMYVNFAHERWGRVLYENFDSQRSYLLRETKALVEANCPRGVVQAINLAVFVRTPIRSLENMRYLDRYDASADGTDAGRFVYFGLITPGNDRYTLVHHDENGLERYLRTNSAYEDSMARMAAREAAERRLQTEGLGAIFKDYCTANPAACAGWAAMIIQAGSASGGSSAKSGSNEFMTCMTNCRLRAPSAQAFCQASCYEFIAR